MLSPTDLKMQEGGKPFLLMSIDKRCDWGESLNIKTLSLIYWGGGCAFKKVFHFLGVERDQ